MHSVLVTGGAGYIGSHMVQALRRAGYRTVVLDNLSEGHRAAVQDADLVEESLADRAVLRAVLLRHRPSAILHFAASSRVEESVENPILYYKNNLVGTLNLLEAALEAGVLRFVYSSTCSVYGEPQEVPITEEHPTVPINPYGWSKLASERLLAETARAYGMRYVVFRYFNAAGAEPKAKLGEDHRPETHLIPLALRSAVFQDQDLTIYGKDYPTPDGTCVRDYIHVLDLVDAHLQGLRHLEEEGDNIILNLGTETGFSVVQVLEAVERVTGLSVPHRFGNRRPGDPAVLVASNRKAKEILGWEPTRTLDDMIRSAYDFLRYRPEGYPAVSEFGRMMEPEPQPEMD